MKLRHPFERLSPSGQKTAFIALFIAAIALMVILSVLGQPLKTKGAPGGIVSFELAGELPLAQNILGSWGPTERIYAGVNLGLDYLFLVVYASAIALGCVLVAGSLSGRAGVFSVLGVVIGWAQFGAALLDCLENYALIRLLVGSTEAWLPVIARWCAVPKFLIVAVGLVYVVMGGIVVKFGKE